jgi:hypothetical protein
VARAQEKYRSRYAKEWDKCYAVEAQGLTCDTATRDASIAKAESSLRDRIGGAKDRVCAGQNLTPITLGHGNSCPVPCATMVLFDMGDVAACSVCIAKALTADTLNAAYGFRPPAVPGTLSPSALACQKALGKAASGLTAGWTRALASCEDAQARSANAPPVDCSMDPGIARAQAKSASRVASCDSLAGIPGCATSGTPAATSACIESAVGPMAPRYVGVAYP